MTARWTAFGLWAGVAASLVFWALKLFVSGTPVPPHATLASTAATPRGDLTRLFGRDPEPEAEDEPVPVARFHLLGVVAPRGDAGAREGVALIAVDDKPPRAYRVGAVVEGETVLQSVRQRGAALGPRDGPAKVSLDLPPPLPAATGSLPVAGAAPPMLAPPPRLPMAGNAANGVGGVGVTRPAIGLAPGAIPRPQRPPGFPGQVTPPQAQQAPDEDSRPGAQQTQ